MRPFLRLPGILTMTLLSFGAFACGRPGHAAAELPTPKEDLPAPDEGESSRAAVFAAGCFWCVEAVFERLDGVADVTSGYAGGTAETANYEAVSTGGTDHAEAVKITYDPKAIGYAQLLRVFFATHDPTTKDRQGPDRGRQYRSAIFYASEEEKRVAEAYIEQLGEAEAFKSPIVTTLEPLTEFYPAEKYHQDFAAENPRHPYVQAWVPGKIEKLTSEFSDLLDVAPGLGKHDETRASEKP